MASPSLTGKLLLLDSVPSTQDRALALVRAGNTYHCGVRALHQTAGRGRRGARWDAPPGTCLLVTYIVRGLCAEQVPYLGFAAAVAVAEAIDFVLAPCTGTEDLHATVKWPNDVQLNGLKVAGILVETVSERSVALVGVGLNVNVASFAPGLANTATSLLLEAGRQWDLEDVEREVRASLASITALGWPEVRGRWRARDATAGIRYRALTDEGEVEGTAVGVADSGELLLRAGDGRIVHTMVAASRVDR